ncbi:hypothetical protein ACIA5H_26280 [Nocardia sp. NPDC051900]
MSVATQSLAAVHGDTMLPYRVVDRIPLCRDGPIVDYATAEPLLAVREL